MRSDAGPAAASDGNAAAISVGLRAGNAGATSAQGIFLKSTGGTTGKIINYVDPSGVTLFALLPDGSLLLPPRSSSEGTSAGLKSTKRASFQPRAFSEHVPFGPVPVLPAFHNPPLERRSTDPVDLAPGHDLEYRGQRRFWEADRAFLFHLDHKQVCRIVAGVRHNVQAVAPPIGIGNSYRAPSTHGKEV